MAVILAAGCGPQPIPPSGPQEIIAEVSEAELAALRARLTCGDAATKVFCGALDQFGEAEHPSGRPAPVAFAGASLAIPTAPGAAPESPILVGSFLVLSDSAARQDMIVPKTPEEKEQLKPLLAAVLQSKPIPSDNPAVVFARSRTGPLPAQPSEKSLAWVRDTRGYAREADDKVIVVEWTKDAVLVSVFPKGS